MSRVACSVLLNDLKEMTSRDNANAAQEYSFSELNVLCSAVETTVHPSTRGTLLSWITKLEDVLEECPESSICNAKLITAKLAHNGQLAKVMQLDQAQFQALARGWLSMDDEAIPPDADEAKLDLFDAMAPEVPGVSTKGGSDHNYQQVPTTVTKHPTTNADDGRT